MSIQTKLQWSKVKKVYTRDDLKNPPYGLFRPGMVVTREDGARILKLYPRNHPKVAEAFKKSTQLAPVPNTWMWVMVCENFCGNPNKFRVRSQFCPDFQIVSSVVEEYTP